MMMHALDGSAWTNPARDTPVEGEAFACTEDAADDGEAATANGGTASGRGRGSKKGKGSKRQGSKGAGANGRGGKAPKGSATEAAEPKRRRMPQREGRPQRPLRDGGSLSTFKAHQESA
jgi:hypothetical protein